MPKGVYSCTHGRTGILNLVLECVHSCTTMVDLNRIHVCTHSCIMYTAVRTKFSDTSSNIAIYGYSCINLQNSACGPGSFMPPWRRG